MLHQSSLKNIYKNIIKSEGGILLHLNFPFLFKLFLCYDPWVVPVSQRTARFAQLHCQQTLQLQRQRAHRILAPELLDDVQRVLVLLRRKRSDGFFGQKRDQKVRCTKWFLYDLIILCVFLIQSWLIYHLSNQNNKTNEGCSVLR